MMSYHLVLRLVFELTCFRICANKDIVRPEFPVSHGSQLFFLILKYLTQTQGKYIRIQNASYPKSYTCINAAHRERIVLEIWVWQGRSKYHYWKRSNEHKKVKRFSFWNRHLLKGRKGNRLHPNQKYHSIYK